VTCTCKPNLAYFFIPDFIEHPDRHLLADVNTYGILFGMAGILLLWAGSHYYKWELKKVLRYLILPLLLSLAGSLLINLFANKPLFNLSTLPFAVCFFVFASVFQLPRPLLILFILSLGIARLGCHISGDGHWGKQVQQNDRLYSLFKDCTYRYNVQNEGLPIRDCSYQYDKELKVPHYPVGLIEFFLFGFLATLFYFLHYLPEKWMGVSFILLKIGSSITFLEFDWSSQLPFLVLSSVAILFLSLHK
jgi:hypothetical protein